MSVDRYEQEFHLTTSGWQSGTSSYYGKSDHPVAPPDDRVLTVVKEVEQTSGWSPEDVEWRVEWKSPDQQTLELLVQKFGQWPPSKK